MYTVGIITISDKGAAGRREDKSGQKIRQMLPEDEYEVVSYKIIPDERKQIADELVRLSDDMKCNLVLMFWGGMVCNILVFLMLASSMFGR